MNKLQISELTLSLSYGNPSLDSCFFHCQWLLNLSCQLPNTSLFFFCPKPTPLSLITISTLRAVPHWGQALRMEAWDWPPHTSPCLTDGTPGGIPVARVRGGRMQGMPHLPGLGGWQLRAPRCRARLSTYNRKATSY